MSTTAPDQSADRIAYPVDSATRACCQGLGRHTPHCPEHTELSVPGAKMDLPHQKDVPMTTSHSDSEPDERPTKRLFAHRLEARYLAEQVAALQRNGSDVYWAFLGCDGEPDRTAPLIERVLPVDDDVMVHFAEALPPRPISANEVVSIHFVAGWA